mgnify:FL=1|tara:strand:- start:446 stop:1987 length:1542 start_codon:yes stop_codon:yes gene_type:complete
MSDAIVKHLNFGEEARDKVFKGIDKLTKAVSSTLGAGGKCVMLENSSGKPQITKDGVTVANTITLLDPVENMGATLLKEAARQTVKEAGDGTTTATVLAHSILTGTINKDINSRKLKQGISTCVDKVIDYLEKESIDVEGDMLNQVATISANNDEGLGAIIASAFKEVGPKGVVSMETSRDENTTYEVVDGAVVNKGLKNYHFVTDQEKHTAELKNPLILLVENKIEHARKIQSILEYVIKNKRSLLIIAECDLTVSSMLAMNKIKGNIKVNIVDSPDYGINRKQILQDIAAITGAKVINEDLGDDIDLIQPDYLGEASKCITNSEETIIQVEKVSDEVKKLIESVEIQLKKATTPGKIIQLEKRLALLNGKVGVIKVGANSEVELKEKSDRVEDAICATKAAIKEGILPGGGIALLNAAQIIKANSESEKVLLEAIKAPFKTILANAGIEYVEPKNKDQGLDVVTGNMVNMIQHGIIDPLLVTKSALKNAASVATTILSTDCVINNVRHEGN